MNTHTLPVTVQVGKAGITPSLIEEIKKQLKARKHIKVRLLKACLEDKTKQELFKELPIKTGAQVIHKVGFIIILEKK
ncbi:YhbY family RNA-binding protein [Candidatus Woesearchaeota archaeon]|nr:YhbY family RNA-binding protein [Candidatus Woesearchaeota archaeon]